MDAFTPEAQVAAINAAVLDLLHTADTIESGERDTLDQDELALLDVAALRIREGHLDNLRPDEVSAALRLLLEAGHHRLDG